MIESTISLAIGEEARVTTAIRHHRGECPGCPQRTDFLFRVSIE